MKERCIIDIGESSTRMLVYKNLRYKLVHTMDIGIRRVYHAVADEMNIDEHLAKTYLENHYQDCDGLPAAVNIYRDISVEILKGLNFYEVSDMTSRLKDVTFSGMGAQVGGLMDLLKERISMEVTTISELLPQYAQLGDFAITAPSLGILI